MKRLISILLHFYIFLRIVLVFNEFETTLSEIVYFSTINVGFIAILILLVFKINIDFCKTEIHTIFHYSLLFFAYESVLVGFNQTTIKEMLTSEFIEICFAGTLILIYFFNLARWKILKS